jgi:hypothetical protein
VSVKIEKFGSMIAAFVQDDKPMLTPSFTLSSGFSLSPISTYNLLLRFAAYNFFYKVMSRWASTKFGNPITKSLRRSDYEEVNSLAKFEGPVTSRILLKEC